MLKLTKDNSFSSLTCAVCGKPIQNKTKPAYPLKDGYCCDSCFDSKVLPARIKGIDSVKAKDSVEDVQKIYNMHNQLISTYKAALTKIGDGLEKQTYEAILGIEEKNLKQLDKLLNAYKNTTPTNNEWSKV
jgi:hypothetical protein